MQRYALVTLQIGDSPEFEFARQMFQAVSKRYDWSFEIINERKIGFVPMRKKIRRIHFEKFQVGQLLNIYDRILYLDSDILINPSFPNIFELVESDAFGCVLEDTGPLKWKRDEERKRAQKKLGKLETWSSGYFNAGMFVVSRMHQPIFSTKWKHLARGRWPDQTTLNYQVRAHGFKIHSLPIEYNYLQELCPNWGDPTSRRTAHIVHYAGPEAKLAMRSDLECVKKTWLQ